LLCAHYQRNTLSLWERVKITSVDSQSVYRVTRFRQHLSGLFLLFDRESGAA